MTLTSAPAGSPSQSLSMQKYPSVPARFVISPDFVRTGAAYSPSARRSSLTPVYCARPWFALTLSLSRAFYAAAVQQSALEPGYQRQGKYVRRKIRRDRVPRQAEYRLISRSAEYRRLSRLHRNAVEQYLADGSRHADACVPFRRRCCSPDIMTASHSSSARRTVFSAPAHRPGHMPYLTHRAPKRESIAQTSGRLRRASVLAGAQPASTSSSPVEIIPTFILPVTGTAVTPAAAKRADILRR